MNPARILELAGAGWGSAALLAANECGVFAALANGPLELAAFSARTQLPERSGGMLLDALVALGLVEQEGAAYRNSPEAAAFLVPGRPGSLAGALGYNHALLPAWARLAESVRTDQPVVPSPTYLGADPQRTRAFVLGMHHRALAMGHAIAGAIDTTGRRRLVDVAGGPGTLASILCRRAPELSATVLELGPIAAVGRELVAEAGLAARISFVDCDVLSGDLGAGHDLALVSGLLHREPPEACRALLARLHAAMAPGGAVYLVDVMRDESRAGPPFAALFALNMLLTSERGGAHADVDHVAWLNEVGFREPRITRLPAPMVHTIVSAVK
ncbi:MAG: hypothetical protein EXR73_04955 [Myxococcales bacterium]|nr:hypothetical protein [Myxococcales bacterium]